MKSRKSTSFLMFVPPMLLLTIMWSSTASAVDIKSFLNPVPGIFSSRNLAVIEGDKEEFVTRPEDISNEDLDEEQVSIAEASDEVLEKTPGGLPAAEKEEITEVAEVEKEVVAEVKDIAKVEKEEKKKDTVVCETSDEAESLTETITNQEQFIMQELIAFFQTVTIPKLMQFINAQSFRAPELYTGYSGIPARTDNFSGGLGLNLHSMSDIYNMGSMSRTQGGTVINNYNVSGDFYNGAYNGGGAIAQETMAPSAPQMFNPGMNQSMMNNATAAPYGFDFNAGSVANHSRFDQMNGQNMMTAMPVATPALIPGPAPAAFIAPTNVPSMRNTIPE